MGPGEEVGIGGLPGARRYITAQTAGATRHFNSSHRQTHLGARWYTGLQDTHIHTETHTHTHAAVLD